MITEQNSRHIVLDNFLKSHLTKKRIELGIVKNNQDASDIKLKLEDLTFPLNEYEREKKKLTKTSDSEEIELTNF
jgi:hypothetical protein